MSENESTKDYHGKTHYHIGQAMFPHDHVARWMSRRTWGEAIPDAALLSMKSLISSVESEIEHARILYELRAQESALKNDGFTDDEKKLTTEEKQKVEISKQELLKYVQKQIDVEIEKHKGDIKSPEKVFSEFCAAFIKHKEDISPSVDGERSEQGFKIEVSGGGQVMRKKKRGIWGRIRGRKEETEMVNVVDQG